MVVVPMQGECEEAYTAVVCQHVQHHLASHTKRVFDSPVLPAAQAYVAAVPLEFLRLLLAQVTHPQPMRSLHLTSARGTGHCFLGLASVSP